MTRRHLVSIATTAVAAAGLALAVPHNAYAQRNPVRLADCLRGGGSPVASSGAVPEPVCKGGTYNGSSILPLWP